MLSIALIGVAAIATKGTAAFGVDKVKEVIAPS